MNLLSNEITIVIFVFLLLISVVNFLYFDKGREIFDNVSFVLIFITFLLIVIYRTGIVTDEYSYLKEYIEFGTRPFYFGFSFYAVNYILHHLSVSPDQFIVIMPIFYGVLSLLFCVLYGSRGSRSILLLLLIFSYHAVDFYFNIYRQGLASIFILFGYCLYKERKLILSVILFTIAIGFHWASPIVIFAILMSRQLSEKQWNLSCGLICLFLVISFITKVGLLELVYNTSQNIPYFSDFKMFKSLTEYYGLAAYSDFSLYSMSIYGRMPMLFMILSYITLLYILRIRHSVYLILLVYAVLMIEIPYPIRNFYFALSLLPMIVIQASEKASDVHNLRLIWIYYISSVLVSFSFSPIWLVIFN
ncbi:EpsG family protein [Vibrio cyclitrophicus]